MDYMLLDANGNAIAVYQDESAARAALRSLVAAEPDAAGSVIVCCGDDGMPIGSAIVVDDERISAPVAVHMSTATTGFSGSARYIADVKPRAGATSSALTAA